MKNGHEKTQKGTSNDSATSHPFPVTSNGDHSSAAGLVVAADRPADVVAFEQQVVGFFVDAADLLGVPKSVAAIYGICFASPEPLSFSDIDERLDISSGSISQGLRVLKEVGALKVADATGAHRDPHRGAHGPAGVTSHELRITARSTACYTPDLELRKLILRWLENRLQNELKSGHSRLEGIVSSIPNSYDGSAAILQERFTSLQTWHDKARALLPMAKTFLKLT